MIALHMWCLGRGGPMTIYGLPTILDIRVQRSTPFDHVDHP